MRRFLFTLGAAIALAGCTNPDDLNRAPVYLGNFNLGHNVVVSPELRQGALSREATPEEWIVAMTEAMDARFSRYQGTKTYHFGINVEGFVLAEAGLPVVASPKSLLIFNLTVWDDAAGQKLNDPAETFTVFEDVSPNTVVGSGVTQTREEQIASLSRTAAKQIQIWLVSQNDEEGWFEDDGRPAKFKPRGGAPRPAGGSSFFFPSASPPDEIDGLEGAISQVLTATGESP